MTVFIKAVIFYICEVGCYILLVRFVTMDANVNILYTQSPLADW